MKDTLIIIPAKNESKTIPSVIENIKVYGYNNILVVDDASTDDTAEQAQKHGATVISLAYNMGAWRATQTGFRYALQNKFKNVITMDADGQHLGSQIAKMLTAKLKGFDLVIGSCTSRGSKSRLLTWRLLKAMGQFDIGDLTSGFRVYGYKALRILSGSKATMLEYQDIGVLLLAKHLGLSSIEVQVEMRTREVGASRIFNSWLAVFNYLTYTFVLTMAKSIPVNRRQYKYNILKDNTLD